MTHRPARTRRAAFFLLALALLLTAATQVSTAQKRPPAQKKSDAKKNPFEPAKSDASKTRQTAAPQANNQTPTAQQLPPSILVRWQGRPGVDRYRLQLATDERFE